MSEQNQTNSKKRKKDLRWEAIKISTKLKKRKLNDGNDGEKEKEDAIKKLGEIRSQVGSTQ